MVDTSSIMLRCSTPQGMAGTYLVELFTDSFIDELTESSGCLSLESSFEQMMAMAGCVVDAVDTGCDSIYGKAGTVAQDVDRYGVDAMVNMRGANTLVGVFGGTDVGCCVSVRDAMLCYACGIVKGIKVGAKLEPAVNAVGVVLAEDNAVPATAFLQQLVGYWRGVKQFAVERGRHRCSCMDRYAPGDGRACLRWLSTEGGRRGVDVTEDVKYEVLPGGNLRRHDTDVCEWFQPGAEYTPYVVSMDDMKAAVSPGYDRWIHDALGLCCGAVSEYWKYGVREVLDVGWMVARQYLCDGDLVCGITASAENILREMRLVVARRDERGVWYKYTSEVFQSWSTGVQQGSLDYHGVGELNKSDAVFSVEMLVAWFIFTRCANLGLIDVLRAVNYRHSVGRGKFVVGREWVRYGDLQVSGQYRCPCEEIHSLSG